MALRLDGILQRSRETCYACGAGAPIFFAASHSPAPIWFGWTTMRPILVHRLTRRWGKRGLPRGLAFTPALASTFWLQGCSAFSRGFLAPAGPIAAAERHELFVVSAIMLLVI